ncbi:hypothetical protein L596_002147 [Steinernema carpocapsae]|uniref:Uncharacterized protein n=1 Tax=Steinernema carpocapsae TaxID=34508 RepID=A0A4U8UR07_STECR|nr:hypothetical protein L596_002147 [Steinernema carpocapsae]
MPSRASNECSCAISSSEVANFRYKLEDFEARRLELLAELLEYQQSEQFICETERVIKELQDERDAHTGINQINQDKKGLETVVSEERDKQREMEEVHLPTPRPVEPAREGIWNF